MTETNLEQKKLPQSSGIEISDLLPDFFDAEALREPPYRLKRIDSKGYRYYAIEQEDGNFIFYISTTSLIAATCPTSRYLIEWMVGTPNYKACENSCGLCSWLRSRRSKNIQALRKNGVPLPVNCKVSFDTSTRPSSIIGRRNSRASSA